MAAAPTTPLGTRRRATGHGRAAARFPAGRSTCARPPREVARSRREAARRAIRRGIEWAPAVRQPAAKAAVRPGRSAPWRSRAEYDRVGAACGRRAAAPRATEVARSAGEAPAARGSAPAREQGNCSTLQTSFAANVSHCAGRRSSCPGGTSARCSAQPCVNASGTTYALRALHDLVVADRGRGAQSFLDVAGLEQLATLREDGPRRRRSSRPAARGAPTAGCAGARPCATPAASNWRIVPSRFCT